MSRLIKSGVKFPDDVGVSFEDGSVYVSGKKGKLSLKLHISIGLNVGDDSVFVVVNEDFDSKSRNSFYPMLGTTHRLVLNMIKGVTEGFSKKLIINGVGYRCEVVGKHLKLNLGFSHNVEYSIPEGINITCLSPTEIVVSGIDKQTVGQVSADIRGYRKPEPYKGKGIRYHDEFVFRKESKKK